MAISSIFDFLSQLESSTHAMLQQLTVDDATNQVKEQFVLDKPRNPKCWLLKNRPVHAKAKHGAGSH